MPNRTIGEESKHHQKLAYALLSVVLMRLGQVRDQGLAGMIEVMLVVTSSRAVLVPLAIATQQYIQTFADTHPPGSKLRPGDLDRPLELVRQTVQEGRRLVKGLRPTTLDDFGLVIAVRQSVEELQNEGWEIGYEETLGGERLPTDVEITLFRVTQEALNNVQKHAQTTEVRIALTQQGRKVRLEIRDEGRGFEPSVVFAERGPVERVGLSSMRERVALLGGELEIRSKLGAGTSVVAEVTFEGSDADHEEG